MNVTFMLGNGFDLSCGLKSSFKDVCTAYCSSESKTSLIEIFKQNIKKDFDTWGDFEMAMAAYTKNVNTEESFLECIHDFNRFLKKYLFTEERRFAVALEQTNAQTLNKITKECVRSLKTYYTYTTKNDARLFNDMIMASINKFNFISFNYTDFLDKKLIENANRVAEEFNKQRFISAPEIMYLTKSVLHIHGTLNEGIVLGVDNDEQLKESGFTLGEKTKRAFVKPYLNENYDFERLDSSIKSIHESDVVCVFGMSLGDSDKMWKDALNKWIGASNKHHLIIFDYDCTLQKDLLIDESMNSEEEAKNKYSTKLGLPSSIIEQIHIPIGHSIFNFKNIFNEAFH